MTNPHNGGCNRDEWREPAPGNTTTDLSSLIERVEKATGPDRALDTDVALAFGWTVYDDGMGVMTRMRDPDGVVGAHRAPAFTASLDADMALAERALPGAQTTLIVTPHGAQAWTGLDDADTGITRHHTAALALILALLRALQAQGNTDAAE